MQKSIQVPVESLEMLEGLRTRQKSISSKFFYDAEGSRIFQKIMGMPEYYLTECEAEIFETHKSSIRSVFCSDCCSVDLVELGAGDGQKTTILIRELLSQQINFRYIPVDISHEAVSQLEETMHAKFPDLTIEARVGDYFHMLNDLSKDYPSRKVVMFLGSNLGNFNREQSIAFLTHLRQSMGADDMLFIGLDLKKEPDLILNAYNDPGGHTRDFNLNLLNRMNRELGADFNPERFAHEPLYDAETGAAKSYLISKMDQEVHFAEIDESIFFKQGERIHTEQSQKYDLDMIQNMAASSGFKVVENYFDRRRFFVDTLWSIR